jgi:hypothetical protein
MANKDYSGYVIPAAAALAILLFGKKLAGVFNVFGDSAADQANQATITSATNYFSPNYYKSVSGAQITTVSYADAFCKLIYDAHGLFNDDEAGIYGAFAALHYKTQVSWMAARFFALYQKDLLGYLNSFLNTEELAKVSAIVLKLK